MTNVAVAAANVFFSLVELNLSSVFVMEVVATLISFPHVLAFLVPTLLRPLEDLANRSRFRTVFFPKSYL